jgi:hypothetical protein
MKVTIHLQWQRRLPVVLMPVQPVLRHVLLHMNLLLAATRQHG